MALTVTLLAVKDAEWLRTLDARLWKREDAKDGHSFPVGHLTEAQLERIFRLIREHELPCELYPAVYGTVCFLVYEHSDVIGTKPERLISVQEAHLPNRPRSKGSSMCGFDVFSPWTHTARNCQLLAFYGLELPRERGWYDY
jgi:hypothetical protein